MVQKILWQLEIDDANLDASQAKVDKFVATLKEAQDRMERLKAILVEMGSLMAEIATQEKKE